MITEIQRADLREHVRLGNAEEPRPSWTCPLAGCDVTGHAANNHDAVAGLAKHLERHGRKGGGQR